LIIFATSLLVGAVVALAPVCDGGGSAFKTRADSLVGGLLLELESSLRECERELDMLSIAPLPEVGKLQLPAGEDEPQSPGSDTNIEDEMDAIPDQPQSPSSPTMVMHSVPLRTLPGTE
jgi:hypothetical protein